MWERVYRRNRENSGNIVEKQATKNQLAIPTVLNFIDFDNEIDFKGVEIVDSASSDRKLQLALDVIAA